VYPLINRFVDPLLYGVNTSAASKNTGSTSTANDFQTTTFTSGWRGFETLYKPESLDLSGITYQNILDLRAGAFSSINVLPAATKSGLPAAIQSKMYFGYNNVALAYGSQINSVTGSGAADTYFVADNNVTITDSSQANKVYLSGSASDWGSSTLISGNITTTTYTKTGSQTVRLIGAGFNVAYYNQAAIAMTHSALDLVA
jgi:hypothetical protein